MRCWVFNFIVFGVFLNSFLVSISLLPMYLLKEFSKPQVRGFDPGDATIALKVKPNTISSELAMYGTTFMAAVVIMIVEVALGFFRYRLMSFRPTPVLPNDTAAEKMLAQQMEDPKPTPKQIWLDTLFVCWLLLVLLLTGAGINGTITSLGKTLIARPRPSFMHFCRPDYRALSNPACHSCGSHTNPGPSWPLCPSCPFVDGDTAVLMCKPLRPKSPWDMWMSFPSGHSSFAMFGTVFVAVYLHSRMRESTFISRYLIALHPLVIFSTLLFGVFTAFSRVADQRHHFTDVLGGSILGSTIGFVMAATLALPLLQRFAKDKLYYCGSNNCGKSGMPIANNENNADSPA